MQTLQFQMSKTLSSLPKNMSYLEVDLTKGLRVKGVIGHHFFILYQLSLSLTSTLLSACVISLTLLLPMYFLLPVLYYSHLISSSRRLSQTMVQHFLPTTLLTKVHNQKQTNLFPFVGNAAISDAGECITGSIVFILLTFSAVR